jgi:hypothetical protein
MKRSSPLPTTLLPVLLVACGAEPRDDAPVEALAIWRLAAHPSTAIGVVEGEDPYQLYGAIGSTRLPDGSIVVANAGSGELRFFDAAGRFVTRAGGRGDGPGEFRNLLRVHRWGGDSVAAYLAAGYRISVFDARQAFAYTLAVDSAGRDPAFPLDAWLYRRYWMDGAWEPEARAVARRTLDRMPVPRDSVGYRYATVAEGGGVWVREPLPPGGTLWPWTVFDTAGAPIAAIETPVNFDVHEIGTDYVLGRWRDADDVNFIHLYAIERSAEEAPPPAWLSLGAPEAPAARTAEERLRLIAALKSDLRNLVTAQEVFFMDHMTYGVDASRLTLGRGQPYAPPEGTSVAIIAASNRGWVAVATHRDLDVICGMGVGEHTPPGWSEGDPACG